MWNARLATHLRIQVRIMLLWQEEKAIKGFFASSGVTLCGSAMSPRGAHFLYVQEGVDAFRGIKYVTCVWWRERQAWGHLGRVLQLLKSRFLSLLLVSPNALGLSKLRFALHDIVCVHCYLRWLRTKQKIVHASNVFTGIPGLLWGDVKLRRKFLKRGQASSINIWSVLIVYLCD